MNKSIPVQQLTQYIYDEYNLSKYGFPASDWMLKVKFKWIRNDATSINWYIMNGSIDVEKSWNQFECRKL